LRRNRCQVTLGLYHKHTLLFAKHTGGAKGLLQSVYVHLQNKSRLDRTVGVIEWVR
jgi:hypothetical protein